MHGRQLKETHIPYILLRFVHICVCITMPTFAIAGVVPQHRAFFDRSKRLEQQPHVVLMLLLVQHPDKELPIFYNPTSSTRFV